MSFDQSDTARYERRVLLLMAMVQFINIWDFMIIMPMGPDFARALDIGTGHIGWISGSYSIAASLVGLISARFIDRFDRRSVLLFSLTGLTISTLAMTLAHSFYQLLAIRMLTGTFGGPVVACSLAIIADVFPESRRGEAMGKVFGSFSIAAVLGVPVGLELSQYFGWQSPFVAVSAVAAITVITIRAQLPPMRRHLEVRHLSPSVFVSLKTNRAMLPAMFLIATSMFSLFMIIPNISAHVQENLGYPRPWLGLLYFFGGASAFFSMRLAGRYADRAGFAKTALYATIGLMLCIYIGFYAQWRVVPVLLIFVLFMVTSSTRNVTSNALISKIPEPQERAGFMALLSAVQHFSCGLGATASTMLLHETPEGRLAGMETVSLIAMLMFIIMPLMMAYIERILARRAPIAPIEPGPLSLSPLGGGQAGGIYGIA